ncbi:MAG: type II toxin-antitoxin system Phd/YefM family antitoxin [Cyanobacteria bacterium P01_F01_bin.143]
MEFLSSGEVTKNFADTLNRVVHGSEQIAIKRSEKEVVYMISAQDYQLFQQLLQQTEDKIDLEEAESRINDPQQNTIGFDEFFTDLED